MIANCDFINRICKLWPCQNSPKTMQKANSKHDPNYTMHHQTQDSHISNPLANLSCTSMYIQGTITSSITTMIYHESKNSFNQLLSHHNHQHMNEKNMIFMIWLVNSWIATSFNENRSLLSTWILLSKHHRRFHRKASFFMPGFPCLKRVQKGGVKPTVRDT